MDKNTRYAISKGYPIVKIALTIEDARLLIGNLVFLEVNGVQGDVSHWDNKMPILTLLQEKLRSAIKTLEA